MSHLWPLVDVLSSLGHIPAVVKGKPLTCFLRLTCSVQQPFSLFWLAVLPSCLCVQQGRGGDREGDGPMITAKGAWTKEQSGTGHGWGSFSLVPVTQSACYIEFCVGWHFSTITHHVWDHCYTHSKPFINWLANCLLSNCIKFTQMKVNVENKTWWRFGEEEMIEN